MSHILVVEDDLQMRRGLKDNLEFEGYQLSFADNGQTALDLVDENVYDLILLDVMLPKLSGFDVCKKMRARSITTPVIMLTAKGEEIDKVLGLEIGADDYVTKPFGLRELLARIKAVLRRYNDKSDNHSIDISIGRLVINFKNYLAKEDGREISLTHKEIEILRYLWDHKNQVVSRDQLLNDVWGYDEMITTRTIDNFILKLRQKLEFEPAHPRILITVHGVGYKLVAN